MKANFLVCIEFMNEPKMIYQGPQRVALKRSKLGSSQFRQSGIIASRLVVD
jgi:hypothetical protein